MTFEIYQKLRSELARDERLLWSGMPRPGLRWRASDWFAVPFTLFWLYMVMFGTSRHGIQTDERSNGSGTITFGPGTSASSWFGRSFWRGANNQQAPTSDMIEGVRRVYALTRERQQANRIRAVA